MFNHLARSIALCLSFAATASAVEPVKLPTRNERIPGTTVQFELVKIPAGSIIRQKGNETETIPVKSIWMGKYEVRWNEYELFRLVIELPTETEKSNAIEIAKTHPSKPYGEYQRGFGGDGYPAVGIHHDGAIKYCQWLSKLTGKKFRLPTETEWDYAATAGGAFNLVTKDHFLAVGWLQENCFDGIDKSDPKLSGGSTHPVGTRPANTFGLHDMIGNAAEWVQSIQPEQVKLVTKGGSFKTTAEALEKSGIRYRQPLLSSWQIEDSQDPKSRWWLSDGPHVGFRIVCEE